MQQSIAYVKRTLVASVSAVLALLHHGIAAAAVYGGGGLASGAQPIGGMSTSTSVISIVLLIINFILNIVVILAILAIIIAGVYLIVSGGDEGQKDKAKNIVLYAVIGIIVIVMSRVIVNFAIELF